MNKSKIIPTLIAFIVIFAIILLAILPVYTIPKTSIIDEINNGVKLSSDSNSKIKGGWSTYSENGIRSEIVFTTFDMINPKYCLIYSNNQEYSYIELITLKRTSLFSFEVESYTPFEVKKPFSEAVSIAQKYDLSKENPDPANITVFATLQPSSGRQYVGSEGVTIPSQGSSESK